MAVLTALRESPGALVRNPVLFVPVLAVMVVQLPVMLLQSVNPVLASVASALVSLLSIAAIPFFQGGLLAMADEALGGQTSLATFLDSGKRHYVAILVAYLVLLAVNFAFGMLAFVSTFAGGILFIGSGQFGGPNLAVLVALGIVAAIGILAYLLVVFFLQFYGQAIVLEGRDAVEGLKRSVGVVRANLLSTVGYVLVAGVAGAIAGIGFAGASTLLSPDATAVMGNPAPEPSLSMLAGVGVGVLVLGTLFGGFFAVFSVAFYREITTE
ncbi:DUF7847 domain-containing protein [Halobellus rufus]|uniref:DUF7847 domain-containing protein n=1 Tax=Halobellus rufus TaxID=1448860 RepID=UPI0006794A5A|nr:hypothetical protein [Halobellus rufus]